VSIDKRPVPLRSPSWASRRASLRDLGGGVRPGGSRDRGARGRADPARRPACRSVGCGSSLLRFRGGRPAMPPSFRPRSTPSPSRVKVPIVGTDAPGTGKYGLQMDRYWHAVTPGPTTASHRAQQVRASDTAWHSANCRLSQRPGDSSQWRAAVVRRCLRGSSCAGLRDGRILPVWP
jgi:hypothetical protein